MEYDSGPCVRLWRDCAPARTSGSGEMLMEIDSGVNSGRCQPIATRHALPHGGLYVAAAVAVSNLIRSTSFALLHGLPMISNVPNV